LFELPLLNTVILLSSGAFPPVRPKWNKIIDRESKIGPLNQKRFYSSMPVLPFNSSRISSLKRIGPHNYEVLSIMVGSLLGDGSMEKSKDGYRFVFYQKGDHIEYLVWLHAQIFKHGYCKENIPQIQSRLGRSAGELVYYCRFRTFTFSSFDWIYEGFYSKGKKALPCWIEQYLSPVALAIWITSSTQSLVDYGRKRSSHLRWDETLGNLRNGKIELYTEFTKTKYIDILVSALKDSFGIVGHKYRNKTNYYTVVISLEEYVTKFQSRMSSYDIPCDRYKFNKVSINYLNKRLYSSNNKPNNSEGSSIEAIASYYNPLDLRSTIYKENLNKAGIYCWTNLITGKIYIGSSSNLGKRFSGYFSINFLKRETLKTKSMIYFALLKYGHSSFKLEILEYCDSKVLISREQIYLDLLKPEYNILDKAGSSLGFKHSESTIAKFKEIGNSRVYSEERKAKFAALNLNRSEEFNKRRLEQILELNLKKGHSLEVINVLTNETTLYSTIRQAASALEISHTTIRRYLKSNELFKGTYKFRKV